MIDARFVEAQATGMDDLDRSLLFAMRTLEPHEFESALDDPRSSPH